MFKIQAIMKYVDFTVQRNGENLELLKGRPAELGIKTTKYIVMTADATEVRVWLVSELDNEEKHRLIQSIVSLSVENIMLMGTKSVKVKPETIPEKIYAFRRDANTSIFSAKLQEFLGKFDFNL
jgi:hypothetical protein